jgi:Cellulase (glycosyl hydrolase family 5)
MRRMTLAALTAGSVAIYLAAAGSAVANNCTQQLVTLRLCTAKTTYGVQADPPHAALPTDDLFGFFSIVSWFPDYGTDTAWERERVTKVGSNAQRWLVNWTGIQPAGTTPPFLDAPRGSVTPTNNQTWSIYSNDHLYESLVADGMRPIIGVYRAPGWAKKTGQTNANVPESQFWTEFVKALAKRYPSAIIEGDNEPNLSATPVPAAEAVRMQRELYTTVKGVSSTQTVIGPALTDGPVNSANSIPTYLGAMYANGLKGYMDGMAFHPYPGATMENFDQAFTDVEDAMADAGDDLPLYITEVGATNVDEPWGVPSEQAQSDLVEEMADSMAANPDVRAVMWMTLRENHGYAATEPYHGDWAYGWLKYDATHAADSGAPKIVYCTFVARAGNTYDQCP